MRKRDVYRWARAQQNAQVWPLWVRLLIVGIVVLFLVLKAAGVL